MQKRTCSAKVIFDYVPAFLSPYFVFAGAKEPFECPVDCNEATTNAGSAML